MFNKITTITTHIILIASISTVANAFGTPNLKTEKLLNEARQATKTAYKAQLDLLPPRQKQIKRSAREIAMKYFQDHNWGKVIPPTQNNLRQVAQQVGAKSQRDYEIVLWELRDVYDMALPLIKIRGALP